MFTHVKEISLRALLERVISIPASCPKILLDAHLIIDTSIKGEYFQDQYLGENKSAHGSLPHGFLFIS
jgi:hypothetical protein